MGILLLALFVLPGCGTPTIHLTRSAPGPATHGGKVQKVYDLGDRVDRPYEILGVVSATGNRASVRSKARKLMLAEAGTLGAEALVGYYYDQEITVSTGDADGWAGALAVRFLADGAPASGPSKAAVALPHTVIGQDFGTGKKAEKADAIVRKHARLLLAKKGYYAVFVDDQLSSDFPQELERLGLEERSRYGHPDAESVMLMTLGKRHAFNALFVVGASQAMAAAMYAKSANAIIWNSAAKGDYYDAGIQALLVAGPMGPAMNGLGHIFVPSAKTVTSVHSALVKAFETLPDLTRGTVDTW